MAKPEWSKKSNKSSKHKCDSCIYYPNNKLDEAFCSKRFAMTYASNNVCHLGRIKDA